MTVPATLPAGHVVTPTEFQGVLDPLLVLTSAWTDYSSTFTITASTTNPTKGNSTYNAKYLKIGRTVLVCITVTIGSTFSRGSGYYGFSVPYAPVIGWSGVVGHVVDSGTAERGPMGGRFAGATILGISGTTLISDTSPQTWATGDIIAFTAVYEAAS